MAEWHDSGVDQDQDDEWYKKPEKSEQTEKSEAS
jgi:hypothetical protein